METTLLFVSNLNFVQHYLSSATIMQAKLSVHSHMVIVKSVILCQEHFLAYHMLFGSDSLKKVSNALNMRQQKNDTIILQLSLLYSKK